ncbi:hypothetical protein [Nocardiopsis chromatogenes]|uniref:hypothetical protein n=1 Tax=Nocardiopsis chromatogenes TaxID=280239 RepID=UPI000476E93D|nr:hypothetical protein [Nocardiopsis chromatogenes]
MCRRARNPGSHHVCLSCRLDFKIPSLPDQQRVCPNCAGGLIDAGHDLEVPRRDDAAGWFVLDVLLRAGVTFHSSCCDGPGWRPRTVRQVKERLQAAERTGTPLAQALTTRDPDEIGRGVTRAPSG